MQAEKSSNTESHQLAAAPRLIALRVLHLLQRSSVLRPKTRRANLPASGFFFGRCRTDKGPEGVSPLELEFGGASAAN